MISDVLAVAGCALLGLGVYGLVSSSNLVKQLISIEVAFNGAIVMVAALLVASPEFATLLLVLLAAIATNETIMLIVLILAYYRRERSLASRGVEA
ncbi:MAG: hypothetical protein QXS85_04560 [Acidilobaceae archaeon]